MARQVKKHNLWEQRLQEWQESKLSGMKWCKEKNIAYPTFRYWKSKLQSRVQEVSFEELKDPPLLQSNCVGEKFGFT